MSNLRRASHGVDVCWPSQSRHVGCGAIEACDRAGGYPPPLIHPHPLMVPHPLLLHDWGVLTPPPPPVSMVAHPCPVRKAAPAQ